VDGVETCDHIKIVKRPGGRVPPLPEEAEQPFYPRYHDRVNANLDLEDFGIPYPERFGPGRRYSVAPPPRSLTPDPAPVPRKVAPVPSEDELTKLERAYGTWTDPDKDCKFKLTGGELKVSLPAADHLLGKMIGQAKNNAPRVLREVEGDFTAVVRVTIPVPDRVPESSWQYYAGGLVAWESDQGYAVVRLGGGKVNTSPEAILSVLTRGREYVMALRDLGKPMGSGFVRIKRLGSRVRMAWSRDGKNWKDFEPEEVTWGQKVKVGVVAENNLGKPVEVTFDQFELTQPKQ
jgi:regulation of enolase protein 1 (concanavalin A-like superfamily)